MGQRIRADRLLVERGLFESRARARAAIAAGLVIADGRRVEKASHELAPTAILEAAAEHPYVSRGALKLTAALDHFRFDPADQACLDVGASTGGFSEVLLDRGARRVYAVDVGTGQLHPRLRAHPRLVSLEATDIRTLDCARLDEPPTFATIDVSFISLKLVLPAVTELLDSSHWPSVSAPPPCRGRGQPLLIALIKPQFEAGRSHLKKGIVRDEAVRQTACDEVAAAARSLGWRVLGVIPSPLPGGDGNREFLLGAQHD